MFRDPGSKQENADRSSDFNKFYTKNSVRKMKLEWDPILIDRWQHPVASVGSDDSILHIFDMKTQYSGTEGILSQTHGQLIALNFNIANNVLFYKILIEHRHFNQLNPDSPITK